MTGKYTWRSKKTLAVKLFSVEAKALVDTLANTLAETETQTLG